MEHFQGKTGYVEACKEIGFVQLGWQENAISNVTGEIQDIAFLEGNRYRVDIVITHIELPVIKNKQSDQKTNFRLRISFDYYTSLGKLSYFHEYSDFLYERLKEYAEWQATLIYKMLTKLDQDEFDLKSFDINGPSSEYTYRI